MFNTLHVLQSSSHLMCRKGGDLLFCNGPINQIDIINKKLMVVMMRMVRIVMVMGHCWAGVAISGLITPLNSFHYQWTTQRSRKVNGFDGDDEKMDRTITTT